MLKMENIIAGYEKKEILHGINLTIHPREIITLLGQNGSGKSTILKTIFGFTCITKGKVFLENQDITNYKTHTLAHLGISYLPQEQALFQKMTVLENIILGTYAQKDQRNIAADLEYIFQQFPELFCKQREYAGSLSGGEQRLLALAKVFIQNPRVLLLDEPFLSLAPHMITRISKVLKDLKNKGAAVLIAEQCTQQAVDIADKIFHVKNGVLSPKNRKTAKQ